MTMTSLIVQPSQHLSSLTSDPQPLPVANQCPGVAGPRSLLGDLEPAACELVLALDD